MAQFPQFVMKNNKKYPKFFIPSDGSGYIKQSDAKSYIIYIRNHHPCKLKVRSSFPNSKVWKEIEPAELVLLPYFH